MRLRRTLITFSVLTSVAISTSEAQVSLYPQVSAETNAMGGAGVSFVSDNALATIANPADIGLFSLQGTLSASYMPSIPKQLNALVLDAGIELSSLLKGIPEKLSLGVGYINPNYSYPVLQGENFSNNVETDVVHGLTIGLGVDYIVKLGLGYSMKWVTTKDGFPYYKSTYAPDFGAIVQLPVLDLISRSTNLPVRFGRFAAPFLNITFGYSMCNFADYAPYGDAILPREGNLGWNFEFGLTTDLDNYQWKWISFTWLRQVNSPLTSWGGQAYIYDTGLGDFEVINNIVAGRQTGNATIEKGWQIQLGQFVYLRGGSATGPEVTTYGTFGWGVRLNGFVKTLVIFRVLDRNSDFLRFMVDHFGLRFDYSRAQGEVVGNGNIGGIGFKGEPFESFTVIVR